MRGKNPPTIKYDGKETPFLVAKARGEQLVDLPTYYWWIDKLTPLEARDELLKRFKILITSLVSVIINGRANLFQWPQKSFLKLFVCKGGNLQKMAAKLKFELSSYDAEELNYVGQMAILTAIEITNTNLVSTIIYCFKDAIYAMTKDGNNKDMLELNDASSITSAHSIEDEVAFNIFLESLDEESWVYCNAVLNGDPPTTSPPPKLVEQLKAYTQLS